MSNEPAILVRKVKRAFGAVAALRGVDLEIPRGEFAVILGPNGAGKSTLLRILATLSRPSSGSVQIFGRRVSGSDDLLRQTLGYISHQTYLYPELTASENLEYFARLYGLTDVDRRVPAALEEVELSHAADRRAGGFSRGMQQRLSIARALIHRPSLVLLDEPYTGLDHHAASVLSDLLGGLKDGERTFLMITHNLAQAVALGDRAHILVRGRMVADLRMADLQADTLAQAYSDAVQGANGGRP